MGENLYAGTTGLILDVRIVGVASLASAANAKFYVIPPNSKEETWAVTVEISDGLFRHVVPENKPLVRGTYWVQPYFELADFKGRWGTVNFEVVKHYAL